LYFIGGGVNPTSFRVSDAAIADHVNQTIHEHSDSSHKEFAVTHNYDSLVPSASPSNALALSITMVGPLTIDKDLKKPSLPALYVIHKSTLYKSRSMQRRNVNVVSSLMGTFQITAVYWRSK
jgi:hypothetical protein